jgi:hypothetical protein
MGLYLGTGCPETEFRRVSKIQNNPQKCTKNFMPVSLQVTEPTPNDNAAILTLFSFFIPTTSLLEDKLTNLLKMKIKLNFIKIPHSNCAGSTAPLGDKNMLSLYREAITVCSEIHTKCTNKIYGKM